METLLSIAIALCAGLLVSRFVKPLKLPAVTGYLIAGILIGPYCLGKLGVQGLGFPTNGDVKALSLFNDVALGFIAFAIGNEFRLSQLRHTGKQATVIGIFQALTATLMVDLVLIGLHFFVLGNSMSIADAIVLGAIATATAPAATLMVVRQYKAKGELTDLLLPIVALDDAVGLIVFAISFGVAKAINYGHYDMTSILVEPLLEIVLSILLGFVMGSIFSAAEKYFKSNSKRLSLSITFVILTVALSMMEFEVGGVKIGFSSLLVCMMLGTVFCNVCDFSAEIMDKTDRWTAPLYILFFVLSGAELEVMQILWKNDGPMTVQDVCDMHRLLAIADFKDRFVVPSANRNNTASMLLQGTQGYNLGGGEDMRRRADTIFGGPMNRKIIPLFEEYRRAPDSTQEGK